MGDGAIAFVLRNNVLFDISLIIMMFTAHTAVAVHQVVCQLTMYQVLARTPPLCVKRAEVRISRPPTAARGVRVESCPVYLATSLAQYATPSGPKTQSLPLLLQESERVDVGLLAPLEHSFAGVQFARLLL